MLRAISVSAVFAYAIRPGRLRSGWLLRWIPPILTVVSLPVQALLPILIASDTTTGMQVMFFLTLTWATVLAAPVNWFAVYLPIELAWSALLLGLRLGAGGISGFFAAVGRETVA